MGVTPGTVRAAITGFRPSVKESWEVNGNKFAYRYPNFALFAPLLEKRGIRVGPDGQLLMEPAMLLDLYRKIDKLRESQKEIREELRALAFAEEESTRVEEEGDE
jgi:hypothetical protein